MLSTRAIKKARGFTLIELMIVVAIIGILAAIAIPSFITYQLRSRRTEGSLNVGAIRTAQVAYYGVMDRFVSPSDPNPPAHDYTTRHAWDRTDPHWRELGFEPEGEVYFQYWTQGGVDDEAYTFIISAITDLDADGKFACWAFAKPLRDAAGIPTLTLQLPPECGDGTNVDADGNPVPVDAEYNRVYLASGQGRY